METNVQELETNMQELDKCLKKSPNCVETELMLEAFRRQMEMWELALPPVNPLVLDFGLGQLDSVGLIEYWIANEMEPGYCAKYLFVFNGQLCPAHSHRVKHETFFLMRGCLDVTLDDRSLMLHPGDVLPVSPGQVHAFRGRGNSLLLEMSTPCFLHDNCFQDPRIGAWLDGMGGSCEECHCDHGLKRREGNGNHDVGAGIAGALQATR